MRTLVDTRFLVRPVVDNYKGLRVGERRNRGVKGRRFECATYQAIFFIGHTPLGRGAESGQELKPLPIAISHRDLVIAR